MLKRLMAISVFLCFLLVVTGCATIMSGLKQNVIILSNPRNAFVTINGVPHGRTPLALDLERKDDHYVKIEMEGYEPYEVTITRQINGWVWGNILIGGLIGLAIDFGSGAIYSLNPEDIRPRLTREGMSHLYKEDTLYIATILEPDPTWQRIGELTPVSVD